MTVDKAEGGTIIGDYLIHGAEIGSGGYGKVFRARHRTTGAAVAAKVIDTQTRMRRDAIMHEVHLMQMLKHQHVISLHSFFEEDADFFIFMELAEGGELFSRVIDSGNLQEGDARRLFGQLISAVQYMHGRGVTHRDLKLENVLLSCTDECKVCDFGLAHEFEADPNGKIINVPLREVCGSKSYAAPEVLVGRGYDGFAADIWSCGICLFAMLAGFFPLDGATSSDWRFTRACQAVALGQSLTKTIFGFYNRPCVISEAACELIDGMMSLNPAMRWSVGEVADSGWLAGEVAAGSPPRRLAAAYLEQNAPNYRSCEMLCEDSNGSEATLALQLSALSQMSGELDIGYFDSFSNTAVVGELPIYRGSEEPAEGETVEPPSLARQDRFGGKWAKPFPA